MSHGVVYDLDNPGVPINTPKHILERIKAYNVCSRRYTHPDQIKNEILHETPLAEHPAMIKVLIDIDFHAYCHCK
jgi:hypothetical protein